MSILHEADAIPKRLDTQHNLFPTIYYSILLVAGLLLIFVCRCVSTRRGLCSARLITRRPLLQVFGGRPTLRGIFRFLRSVVSSSGDRSSGEEGSLLRSHGGEEVELLELVRHRNLCPAKRDVATSYDGAVVSSE